MTSIFTPASTEHAAPQVSGADMSDAEREAHIKDCGHLMETAVAEGRADDAQCWMAAMYAAIEARSPEQRARMLAEIETRISEGNCYFMAVGVEHAAELNCERQAA